MLYEMNLADLWPPTGSFLLQDACQQHGRRIVTHGRTYGSLEPDETAGLDYIVLNGFDVRKYAPWLLALYEGPIRERVQAVFGHHVVMPEDKSCDINVNYLSGVGARYEKHVDRQKWTLNLFANTLAPGDGGEFVYEWDGKQHAVTPIVGHGILFDGETIPHEVWPLKEPDIVRITVPMRYFTEIRAPIPGLADHHKHLFGESYA